MSTLLPSETSKSISKYSSTLVIVLGGSTTGLVCSTQLIAFDSNYAKQKKETITINIYILIVNSPILVLKYATLLVLII